jgi:hypothetical protein
MVDAPNGNYWETWMKFLTDHLFKFGLIGAEDFTLFKIVHDAGEAVNEILEFYKIYQSARWVGDNLVIRLARRVSAKAVTELNSQFRDIVRKGEIVQGTALRQEKNEPEIWDLPRLILTPHRRSFGRFRQLIDAINLSEPETAGV